MELFFEKAQCCGCMACVDICLHNAVDIWTDSEGFLYPKVRQELCINCNQCKIVCPLSDGGPGTQSRRYMAVQAKEQALRKASTSGGVFPVLAEYVLKRGGVVYGAGFDSSMRVTHQRAAEKDELCRLVQSKYVQSRTAGIFRLVRQDLREGKQVLFSGTPCQIEALKRFLQEDHPNLLLVDLICYGVPSPEIWKHYVAYLERKYHGRLTEFHFRDKRFTRNQKTTCYKVGGREYAEAYSYDPFVSMYFSNCMLRPSCHTCPFAAIEHSSDITLGDFWNEKNRLPQMNDGMGTSLVILQSGKGEKLWADLQGQFNCIDFGREEIWQPRLVSPSSCSSKRKLFFALWRKLPFFVLVNLFRNKITRRFWYAGKTSL